MGCVLILRGDHGHATLAWKPSAKAETEKPIISQVVIANHVLQLAVMADADERTLKVLAQEVRDDIAARLTDLTTRLTHTT